MKKLLVLTFLLSFTSAVNAQNFYLVAEAASGLLWSIPMRDIYQCEDQGQRLINGKNWKGHANYNFGNVCLEGK